MAKQTFTSGQVLSAAQMTTLQANDYNQTVNAKVASYTLVASDVGTRITMSNAGATAITVNTGIFAAGDTLYITNIGAGVLSITAGTATVTTSASLALAQWESGVLYFTSASAAIWQKYDGASASASPTSANSFVATSETTATNTTLADLATVQALTVTTGTKVLVLLSADMSIATGGGNFIGRYGVTVSGATTRAANANEDGNFGLGTMSSGDKTRYTSSIYLTCTAGSNTFTMKFASGQTGVASTFSNRRMTIIDLGS
jgi:hypothetical protein